MNTNLTGVTVAMAPCGELDLATANAFRDELFTVIGAGPTHLLLDLGGLDFCDSQGLRALVEVANHAEAADGGITITRARPQLRRILTITGLSRRFGLPAGA